MFYLMDAIIVFVTVSKYFYCIDGLIKELHVMMKRLEDRKFNRACFVYMKRRLSRFSGRGNFRIPYQGEGSWKADS